MEVANSIATSGHSCRKRFWLALGGPFLSSAMNGLRNKPSHLVGPPFPAFRSHFSGWHLPGAWVESSPSGVCGYMQSRICLGWLKLPLGAVSSPTAQGNR